MTDHDGRRTGQIASEENIQFFENEEITYCSQNNTMAIFYAQTEQPDLTKEVVPIGKVISDLSIFDHLPSQVEIIFSVK